MSQSTAVATVATAAQQYALRSPIAQMLNKDGARALIEPMLRPGDSYERVIVEVYHAVQKNEDILKCTPQSIVNAVSRAVRSGLVIGEGVHLVPFGTTLQEIYDYKGRIQLITMAGAARAIDAQCVYEHEKFDYTQGTSPTLSHSPIMSPAKRGKMIGAYAIADQGRRVPPKILVLSVEEIDKVRQQYSKTHKKGDLPYWYAQKTCVHRLAKLLPKNPELAKVVALFEAEDAGLDAIANDEAPPMAYPLSAPGTRQLANVSDSEIEGLDEDAETSGAAGSSDGGGTAASSAEPLATQEQKARISELLNSADVDDGEIARIAKVAGAKDYTATAAAKEIAKLEKLVPAGELFGDETAA